MWGTFGWRVSELLNRLWRSLLGRQLGGMERTKGFGFAQIWGKHAPLFALE